MGQGCIDFQRFHGFIVALLFGHIFQRAHIVQAVAKFNNDNANIIGHRHNHFADIFCLIFLFGLEFYLF